MKESKVKQCKHNKMIDCASSCYSCIGCGWDKVEIKKRKERINHGKGLTYKNGLYCLVLGRKK